MTRSDWYDTLFYGFAISASVLGIVVYTYYVMNLDWDIINNMAFYTLVLAQLFNVFNMPHRRESVLINEVTKNIWVWIAIFLSLFITWSAYMIEPIAEALSFTELSMEQFTLTFIFALGSFGLVQIVKSLKRIFESNL